MNTTSVLLATYNSSEFLRPQLDSLFSQSYKKWDLVIRDDGSTDATLEIIQEYRQNYSNIILLQDTKKGIGAKESFMSLLKNTESNYYFFCDHDDIWLPNKIRDSLELMEATEKTFFEKPVIIHSDLRVVNQNLKVISESFWESSGIKPRLLENENLIQVFNCVTGCTMVFNNAAKALAFPYPKSIPMHDWWLAIAVLKSHGVVKHIAKPTILYRQHSANEVGARKVNLYYFINKIKTFPHTFAGQKLILDFLKDIKGLNPFQYYCYKIFYTLIRKI